jgi:hypothetical protein
MCGSLSNMEGEKAQLCKSLYICDVFSTPQHPTP